MKCLICFLTSTRLVEKTHCAFLYFEFRCVYYCSPVLSDSYSLIFHLPFFLFSLLSPFNLPLILYPSSHLLRLLSTFPPPLLLIFYPCPLIFLSHVHIYHFFPLFQFLPSFSFSWFYSFFLHISPPVPLVSSSFLYNFLKFSPGLMTRVWSLIRRPSQSGPWCWVTSRGRVQRLPIRSDHLGAMETVSPYACILSVCIWCMLWKSNIKKEQTKFRPNLSLNNEAVCGFFLYCSRQLDGAEMPWSYMSFIY